MVHMCELTTRHLFVAITNAVLLFQVLLTLTSEHVSGNIFTYCVSLLNVILCKGVHFCINQIHYVNRHCDTKYVIVCHFPALTLCSV